MSKPKPSHDRRAQIQRILDVLHGWGIHTLGELAALDKDQLGARLGLAAIDLWERANGKSFRPPKFVQPAESFTETFEFENEIETVEPLLFILRRFLEQLSVRLGGLYFVAKELTLRLSFTDKSSYEYGFKIPQPTRSGEVLFRMLHTHLENFKSEFPIVVVSLEAQPAKPDHQQFGLFETAPRDPAQLSETLARLTGLLGADRVGVPVVKDTHQADAFQLEPFSWQVNDSPPIEESLPSCALRRFRSPVSAAVLLADNQPAHLRSSQIQGEVNGAKGPYHSSGHWWDENSWTCAEWDLQLENGALCRCHRDEQDWSLDGVYD